MSAYLTPQAESDLEEIGDYIAADNPIRAVSFFQEIRRTAHQIPGVKDQKRLAGTHPCPECPISS